MQLQWNRTGFRNIFIKFELSEEPLTHKLFLGFYFADKYFAFKIVSNLFIDIIYNQLILDTVHGIYCTSTLPIFELTHCVLTT